MTEYAMFAADVVAVCVLVFGLFLFRSGRRELVVAYLGVNVGVMAVTMALATGTVGAGLGLGLFGVLSIIRLRSEELAQREIAYYFAALTLGLLAGLAPAFSELHLALMVAVLVAVWIGDHPRLAPVSVVQEILLDSAVPDGGELTRRVEDLLGVPVSEVTVRRTDLVNDTTLVRVRYRSPVPAARPALAVRGGSA